MPLISIEEQRRIIDILKRFDILCNDISEGLPAEIEGRRKQYEYYRDSLLENIEQFFGEFRGFIRRWAFRYSQYAKISEEAALMSILGKFGLKDS